MIEAQALAKEFSSGRGRARQCVQAVRDVSFSAPDGRITALLGPNGAGKTTTMRMLATLVQPSSGLARVDGHDCRSAALMVRARLGVLSDARGLYPRLTARENIAYFARLHGLDGKRGLSRVEAVIAMLELEALADRRTDGFSQGERMKVALARALVHDPQNLILDEPTNGLDIMTLRTVRALLRRLRDEGRCILLSTHIMQEVVALADEVVIVAAGRSVAQDTPAGIEARAGCESFEEAFMQMVLGEVMA
ncbi:ATP-binding cassette domain-containing protein [Niveibacterium terrae]|uniref:ABC transporter ATP-binding protein n=1 Tax=Niveibacterium terrae TaxID=3373598 RepID=UPI003A8EF5E1